MAQSGHWADRGGMTAFGAKRTFRLEALHAVGEGCREYVAATQLIRLSPKFLGIQVTTNEDALLRRRH